MRKRFSFATMSILVVFALLLGMYINNVISADNIFDQLNKFKDVLSLTDKFYVDTVSTQKLVETAITGLLNNLDPHSVYIPASQAEVEEERFEGSFEGIGVEFDVINDTLNVVSPVPGGPSERLGILAGDKILKINDTSSVGITREMVPKKLRGPKGTHVKVSIYRPGEKEMFDVDITRDKIPLFSVDVSFMVDREVGYVSVNRFSKTTHDEFVQALQKLRAQGMKRLIVDLRNNPGGYLEQAFKMADELLPKGKKVVYTLGRRAEFNEDYVSAGGKFENVSLIILVNHGSASASEIVSGAIQDWDRGLIVGETTYGKGLVQRQFNLADKSAFRLTIARYYTPTGRLIQRPYGKSFDDYRNAPNELDEEEGENFQHKEESDTSRPVFKTPSGRTVYGGGGITPDYIVKSEKASKLVAQLLGKGVFGEYKTSYMDRNGKQLRKQYEKELSKFFSDVSVSDDMLKEFIELAKKKGVTFDNDQLDKDKRYIKSRMKAEIARDLFGNEGWYMIMRADDVQFQKALILFPEAEKIAGLH
jgi:carboxyl-terminal processing protease